MALGGSGAVMLPRPAPAPGRESLASGTVVGRGGSGVIQKRSLRRSRAPWASWDPSPATANCYGNRVGVLLGNWAGGFGGAQTYGTGSLPWSVAVADFNGGGKLDLVTADLGGDDVGVLLGNGDGSFRSAQFSAAGSGL